MILQTKSLVLQRSGVVHIYIEAKYFTTADMEKWHLKVLAEEEMKKRLTFFTLDGNQR